jgi:general secretion pathway protein D
VQRLIERLDIPPKQVHLMVRLIEMREDDEDLMGMQWGNQGLTFSAQGGAFDSMFPFVGHPSTNAVPLSTFGNVGVQPAAGGGVVPLGTQPVPSTPADITFGRLNFQQLSTTLELIRTYTKGRVIQAPQLIALDNEEATIQVGQLVRYAESFVNITQEGQISGFEEAEDSPVNLGIQLLVIPHVTGPDNNVMLTVIPKTESFTNPSQPFEEFESPTFGTLKLPRTTQRIVVTKMMLRNMETGVIGGLREEQEGVTYTKIPLLGDIPLLGWMFKHRQKTRLSTNLLIFVTPTVIDLDDTEALERQFVQLRQDVAADFEPMGMGGER